MQSPNETTIILQAKSMNQDDLKRLLDSLAESYHNYISQVSDQTFDQLLDIYEERFGEYTEVGAVPRGEKVTLPYYLGSLDKLKKQSDIVLWSQKYPGPYVLMDKIDGLTLLFTSSNINGLIVRKLYTRGGGTEGVDVSHLIPYLNLPEVNYDIAIRGEIVMLKETFKSIGQTFKNARNMVSGIVNSKDNFNPELARQLQFLAFRVMNSDEPPEKQLIRLRFHKFQTPYAVTSPTINFQLLQQVLVQRKTEAPYEMDGLVIYQNKTIQYPIGQKPKQVIAFKIDSETAVTTVIDVVWEPSMHKLLKPVIIYQPVQLSGATLQRTSGDNARFIISHNIGTGAIIEITRSGDVIPRITKIIQPAPQPSYPDPSIYGEYGWNTNQVEFVLLQDNPQVFAAKLQHFFDKLDIKGVGPGRVKLMVDSGLNTLYKVLTISPEQLATIPGIGISLANQIYQEIQTKIKNVPLSKLMAASSIFPNIGERRFEAILQKYPNILSLSKQEPEIIAQYIQQVKGFKQLAYEIASRMSIFSDWLIAHPMITISQSSVVDTLLTIDESQPEIKQNLKGITVVFSGFRDPSLQTLIQDRGGRVTTSVSKNTTYLVIKDNKDIKGKAQKAIELGVTILTKDQFMNQFLI